MNNILDKLKGGDLRSIDRAEEVVQDIFNNPALFCEVFEGMLNEDPVVRMRSADAIEKVSRKHPEYLQPLKGRLIREIVRVEQKEVQWHVAQMFSYLKINRSEKEEIIEILFRWTEKDNRSKIVMVNSMETLANLAKVDDIMKVLVKKRIKEIMKNGSPAIINRGKKLIHKLSKQEI